MHNIALHWRELRIRFTPDIELVGYPDKFFTLVFVLWIYFFLYSTLYRKPCEMVEKYANFMTSDYFICRISEKMKPDIQKMKPGYLENETWISGKWNRIPGKWKQISGKWNRIQQKAGYTVQLFSRWLFTPCDWYCECLAIETWPQKTWHNRELANYTHRPGYLAKKGNYVI